MSAATDFFGELYLRSTRPFLSADVTQKEAISDSVEAAENVLTALRGVGDVHRPRVQHAGFVVLKSPDIPSMLVETAFISNSTDERRLRDASHQLVREGLHAGRGVQHLGQVVHRCVAGMANGV